MQRLASKTSRWIPTTNISLIAGLMFFFVSCDINNDDDFAPSSNNTNGNAKVMGTSNVRSNGSVVTLGSVSAVSEGATDLRQVASRMEIPRLKGGNDNLFIVHTTSDGVNFCIEWNNSLRAQRWSAYRWDRSNTGGNAGYSGEFREDPLIPYAYRTTLDDHKSNGYDRGHIIGSADRQRTVEANSQTFYLSNMQPQLNAFNAQGIWYALENRLRITYNKDSFRDTLYVVKGGTISSGKYTMERKIPVPKYFFMALLRKRNNMTANGGYAAVGFWMAHEANTDATFKNYAVSIDELEELTGIDFFCNLPDEIEKAVEQSYSTAVWQLN